MSNFSITCHSVHLMLNLEMLLHIKNCIPLLSTSPQCKNSLSFSSLAPDWKQLSFWALNWFRTVSSILRPYTPPFINPKFKSPVINTVLYKTNVLGTTLLHFYGRNDMGLYGLGLLYDVGWHQPTQKAIVGSTGFRVLPGHRGDAVAILRWITAIPSRIEHGNPGAVPQKTKNVPNDHHLR